MKHLLLAGLLLAAPPALAQASQEEPTGIEALDAKNGFRKYKFETSISEMPNLQKRGKDTYVDPLERLVIGDVNLNSLRFLAYNGKFSAVLFSTVGNANCAKLLEILTAQYGPPQKDTGERKSWIGNRVSMLFDIKTSYGAYNSSTNYATVYIRSNALATEESTADQVKAKKAAADL